MVYWGAIDDQFREEFDDFMQTLFTDSNIIATELPRRGTLYDSFVNVEESHKFQTWSKIVPKFKYNVHVPFSKCLYQLKQLRKIHFL